MTNETSPDQAVEAVALLPCPKCESENVAYDQFSMSRNRWVVACNDCEHMTETTETQVEALALWQNRLSTTPPAADHTDLIARLDKFLADLIDCPDFTEPAADGGITVAMVFQHDAKWLRTKLARADALQAHASPRESRLEAALRQCLPLLEADHELGKEYADADWEGMAFERLEMARTALELG